MLRLFRVPGAAIAAATILALAAAQPAEAAGGRAEARAHGKAARVAAPTRAAVRPVVAASRRPVVAAPRSRSASAAPARSAGRATIRTATRGSERVVTASRGGRIQARAAGRREARIASSRAQVFNFAGRRQVALHGRPGFRTVGLFSAPASASTLPSNGWKSGKPSRARGEGAPRRSGVWFTGLPAADGEQMDCPAGTMAVLARGHSDTFRCMPM
ncbi:hypothetical protein [Roseomonas populi]|uniref:Uncharacterized protein n=1 Tax=Roseomonas populi TaxID=3121582 RepID=A0ABT1X2L3_9PROT|nr:hypothetical protein [Roseomonas pecuniae]MCR0981633.1 hypothetical protein [Roseomonas pecuniae]